MSNNCQVQRTVDWFKEAKPSPTEKDFSVQLGVHFEEIREMIETLSSDDYLMSAVLSELAQGLHVVSESLKANEGKIHIKDPVEFLDSLGDQYVTAVGSGHFYNTDILGVVTEINDSNFSKFDENGKAILNEQGKVIKGPNYFKPSLKKYIK